MFLKTNLFKKLVTNAYKSCGLHVANAEEGIYLNGGYWTIWLYEKNMSKKVKSILVELVGDLPEEGESFLAKKDGGNQWEIPETVIADIRNIADILEDGVTGALYEETDVCLEIETSTIARIYQKAHGRDILMINDMFTQMIDESVIDGENGEEIPYGPIEDVNAPEKLTWYNQDCVLRVCKISSYRENRRKIVEHLSRVKLNYIELEEKQEKLRQQESTEVEE